MTRWDGATGYSYNGHAGIDYPTGVTGYDVIAAIRGTVQFVGWQNPNNHGEGFGFYVRISHADRGYSSLYGHLTDTQLVSAGQFVGRGDRIGLSGNTGYSTGPHLHFGVYSQGGWVPIDPYGWAYTDWRSPDPYTSEIDIGHLWGTRVGTFTSGSIAAKDGSLSAGWESNLGLPGSGTVTAMSIDGSRVGIVRGGTAYAKDGSLNQSQPSASWQLIANNALDIKLAGRRMAVLGTDRWLIMKDGALNSGWYTNVADNVWKIAITPTRIGVLKLSGEFIVKEGSIGSGWYQMMGPGKAKEIALTDNWIGAIRGETATVDQFWATEVLQNNPPWSTIDTQVNAISMGGKGLDKRTGWVKGGHGWAKEEILNGAIIDLGLAVEVAVNSGRAARRTSLGSIYANQTEFLSYIGGGVVGNGSGVRLN